MGVSCHQLPGRSGTFYPHYWCHNHDTIRARGEHCRCPERNSRADEFDAFVFEQLRAALLRREVLPVGAGAVATHQPAPDDDKLDAELACLGRKFVAAQAERRYLADLYQARLVKLRDVQRRSRETDERTTRLTERRAALVAERHDLDVGNRLRQRVARFAQRVASEMDALDFDGRQRS